MPEKIAQLFRQLWLLRQHKSKLLPLAVVLLTLVLLIILKLARPEPPVRAADEKIWTVQTHQLLAGSKIPQLKLYGQVESPYTARLTSSINADVKSLLIHEGDYAKKGQLLLELDDEDVRLTLDENEANVAELKALIEAENNRYKNDLAALKLEKTLVALAEKKLAREVKTSRSKLTSLSSRDTQKQALENQQLALKNRQLGVVDHPARLAQLEARLRRQQAQVQKAMNDAKRAAVKAPFNGIVTHVNVAPGERVRPGGALLEIYDVAHIEIRAQLPNKVVSTVKQALVHQIPLTAELTVDKAVQKIQLDRLAGLISNGGGGVDALFSVNAEQPGQLTIGKVLALTLNLPPLNNVFSVPVASIYGTNRLYLVKNRRLLAVLVDKRGNQFKSGKQFVLVSSDKLKPGDAVITTQLPQAVNGLKVEVRNEPPAQNVPSQRID